MWNQFVRHCVKFFESVWLSHIYFQSSSWIIHRVWLGLISSLVLIKLNLDWVLQLKLFSENSNRVIVPSKRGNKSLDYNHSYLKILNCLNIFKHTMRASSWIFWKKVEHLPGFDTQIEKEGEEKQLIEYFVFISMNQMWAAH